MKKFLSQSEKHQPDKREHDHQTRKNGDPASVTEKIKNKTDHQNNGSPNRVRYFNLSEFSPLMPYKIQRDQWDQNSMGIIRVSEPRMHERRVDRKKSNKPEG
jgi:hypothetical protein